MMIRHWMRIAWAFIKRDFLLTISYKALFLSQISAVIFWAAIFYYVGDVFKGVSAAALGPYKGNYFAFLLIGVAFTDYLTVSLASFTNSIQESQLMGTLEILLLSPCRYSTLLISSSLWPSLFTSLRFLLYLLFGTLIFGLDIGNANPLAAVVIMLLSILCFSSIGIMVSSVTLVFKRGVPVNYLIGGVFSFLGGVAFPSEVLPPWLVRISSYIPLTHSLTAMRRALLDGYGVTQLLPEIGALALFAVVFIPIGLYLVHLAVRRIKTVGNVSHY